MGEGWTCPRCSAVNVEASLVCANCGLTRPDDAGAMEPGAEAGAQATDDGIIRAGEPYPYNRPSTTGDPSMRDPWQPTAPSEGWPAATTSAAADDQAAAPSPDTEGIPGWVPPQGVEGGPPAPLPLWRRIPIGWLIVLVIVGGGAAVGWYLSVGRGSSGEITKAGDLHAKDLRVGDCFDLKDATSDTVGDVTAVPCTTEHQYELFYTGSMPDGDYPGDPGFKTYVQANCIPAFATYVGTQFDDSALDVYWLQPTGNGWSNDDHSVQCAVYHPEKDRLTGSLKGSNQ